LRLANQSKPNFANRSHFLAVAAKAMRQILVNHAKASQRQKRGAGAGRIELDEGALISPQQTGAILDLNEALERLATLDSRKAQVVELKYFGGLKQDEIAAVLKISTVTVRRDWTFARAWLYAELRNAA
jgi:RNA polymerase sigma factor (TIGR02999 family)